MDLRQLRYFVAIVKSKSFSKAALRLRIAQPALSLHVRNMEADLGIALLSRTPQGVLPTDAGILLLAKARRIIADFEDAKQAVREFETEAAGEVRIGLPGTIAEMLSVPLILQTRARYPKIRLKVAEAMSGFVLEWLYDGRVDLGLLYLPVDERGLKSSPILVEHLCLFAPIMPIPGHEPPPEGVVAFADLARLPLVLLGIGHGLRALIDAEMDRIGLELATVIEVDSYNAIKELVGQGLGYSILPVNAIKLEEEAGLLRSWQISEPPFSRTAHLVHPTDRMLSKATLAVEEICREALIDLVETGRWRTRQSL